MVNYHRLAVIVLVLSDRLTNVLAGWFGALGWLDNVVSYLLAHLGVHIGFWAFVFAFGRSFEASSSKLERSLEEGGTLELYGVLSLSLMSHFTGVPMYRRQAVATYNTSGVCSL